MNIVIETGKFFRKTIFRFLPALIWMALIFYGSSRQKVAITENYWLSFAFFKTLHIVEYGVLFLLWRFALYNKSYSIEAAVLISIFYGMTDEFHQSFMLGREGRLRDVFIDALGVLIFWRFILNKLEIACGKNKVFKKFFP